MVRVVLLSVLLVLPGAAQVVNFDKDRPGAVAQGWSQAMTHEGGAPEWEVVQDASAPSKPHVLAQTSTDNTSGRFPLAILAASRLRDGSVSVRFKTISGERDQAAGIVWRYQDTENYYVVRANALEDNVVLYKVEKGKRIALAPKSTTANTYGVKHRVPRQTWSSLKVSFSANRFEVFFDGQKIMEVEDATFTEAGKAGLWTKADSVTWFDDFTITRVK